MCLTAAGTDKNVMGNLRPNLLATNPKMGNAIKDPNDFKLANQDDSSCEIFPVGSGDWSEVNRRIAGDGQPIESPNTVPRSSTIQINKKYIIDTFNHLNKNYFSYHLLTQQDIAEIEHLNSISPLSMEKFQLSEMITFSLPIYNCLVNL